MMAILYKLPRLKNECCCKKNYMDVERERERERESCEY